MFVAQDFETSTSLNASGALCYDSPQDETVRYRIQCEPATGPDGTIRNMSLKQLGDPEFCEWLGGYLTSIGVKEAFAPTVNYMSGVILPAERFTRVFLCSRHVSVRRPGYKKANSDELQACDGTRIAKRKTFLMSAAGCLALVLTGVTASGEEICLCAHAGRNSLIDMNQIRRGKQSRAYFSVVDALVAHAKKLGTLHETLVFRSFFSVPWQSFPHSLSDPIYKKTNQRVFNYFGQHANKGVFREREDGVLCLSLSAVVAVQAAAQGIPVIEVGLHDLPENGDFAKTTHQTPELAGNVRNLVVCTHY